MGMLPIPKEIRQEAIDEVKDLARRFIKIFPDTLKTSEQDKYIGFLCLVDDEETGITRTLLEKLGYVLEAEQEMPHFYWIALRARMDKPKKR
jgi:hypothetical protein